ncbi:MAG: hypothetical protein K2K88_01650 [Muribaculaceae bacterium]|nr:hypothetical protein [Muribaculaceae bacterium]MDE6644148.1 hypothetical protein [Muribaculaceae bacterium]
MSGVQSVFARGDERAGTGYSFCTLLAHRLLQYFAPKRDRGKKKDL